MNVLGTKRVIELCKKLRQLDAFIHVSTLYHTDPNGTLKEVVYAPPAPPHRIIELAEWISDDLEAKITPPLIEPRANTYAFTKAIAETLVVEECQAARVPCAIARLSLVGGSWREPFPGWVDNINILSSITIAAGYGIDRLLNPSYLDNPIDCVPIDTTVNMLIAQAYIIAITIQ